MAKGLLISYAGYPSALSSLFPDNGLASLAAVLRAAGHECVILDLNTAELMDRLVEEGAREQLQRILPELHRTSGAELVPALRAVADRIEAREAAVTDALAEQIVQRCLQERFDFVGFKLWSGDGFTASLRMAERIRARCPSVRLFAGGPAVHYSGHVVAREAPIFDAVIDGEGEDAILALAEYVEGRAGLEAVPNRLCPSGDTRAMTAPELSRLPLPSYEATVYPSVATGEKLRLFCLDESRGCPMRCSFCINCSIEGSRWRMRNVDQVIEDVRRYLGQYHSTGFRLAGTFSPPALVRQICTGIVTEGLKVSFGLSLHSAAVKPRLLESLKQAGCQGIFMGVESGSDRILTRVMGKSTTALRLRRALEASLAAGLFTVGSFIFPAPLETAETEQETRALIEQVFSGQPHGSVIVTIPGLLPRTAWWQDRTRHGFELEVDDDAYRRVLLRYKIRHLLPPTLWEGLPYRLDGKTIPELARRTAALQAWARERGIVVNLPDHDAHIGRLLGRSPVEFAADLRRLFFTGDGAGLSRIVDAANQALRP